MDQWEQNLPPRIRERLSKLEGESQNTSEEGKVTVSSVRLGSIEKPEAEQFKELRKIYSVPLLVRGKDAPDQYSQRLDEYWDQVGQHIANLESKIGAVAKVYHESIASVGGNGIEFIERLNIGNFQIIKDKCNNGAELELIEDDDLSSEVFDWERFMMIGFTSKNVANVASEAYSRATKKRYEYMADRIEATLKGGEAGLLFISENNGLQFPKDIQVFSVMPPAYDQLKRWIRDYSDSMKTEDGKTA